VGTHFRQVARIGAVGGERRQRVEVEEVDGQDLVVVFRLAAK
jgi:hypothetical protein